MAKSPWCSPELKIRQWIQAQNLVHFRFYQSFRCISLDIVPPIRQLCQRISNAIYYPSAIWRDRRLCRSTCPELWTALRDCYLVWILTRIRLQKKKTIQLRLPLVATWKFDDDQFFEVAGIGITHLWAYSWSNCWNFSCKRFDSDFSCEIQSPRGNCNVGQPGWCCQRPARVLRLLCSLRSTNPTEILNSVEYSSRMIIQCDWGIPRFD